MMPIYNQSSDAVQYLSQHDKHLGKVIQMVGPLSYTLAPDGYAFLVNHIIGQMLSNKVAAVLIERLKALCHGNVTVATVSQLSDEQIRQIGISWAKVSYLRHLTRAVNTQLVRPELYPQMADQAVMTDLMQIKGIGQWSAKMYLIFVLDRPDVLPEEDVAFLQSYGWVYKTSDYHAKKVRKKCQKWHPYASLAARYLYRALDGGLTKQPFHLFK